MTDKCRQALAELVALKNSEFGYEWVQRKDEYRKRLSDAWIAARAALAEQPAAPAELSDERIQLIADDIMGCSAMRAYRLQLSRAVIAADRAVRSTTCTKT